MHPTLARLRAFARSIRRNTVARDEHDADLDAELHAYVDQLADRYEHDGLSPTDARRAALVATGGVTQVKEATRDAWLGRRVAELAREFRYAFRSLRRAPGFVIVAVLTLGLGIGGATTIASVISAVLFQKLPAVARPDELFTVERVNANGDLDDLSYADYLDIRDRATTIAGLSAYNGTWLTTEDERAGRGRAWISYVSDNFFTTLGVHAVLGRTFAASEVGRYTATPVAVLGYKLWQTRYKGDSSVVGSTIKLADQPVTIIGVAPEGFIGAMRLHAMEMWVSLITMQQITNSPMDDLHKRDFGSFRIIGRRAGTATIADVRRDVDRLSAQLAATYVEDRGRSTRVWSGTGMTADERDDAARTPRMLSIAIAVLLLIACANVAGLSLVRAAAKRRELATRLALGASRGALARQLVIETTVIAVAAAGVGIAIATVLLRSATIMTSVAAVRELRYTLDWRTLVAAFFVTTTIALLVAVVPAFQVSRTDIGLLMKDGAGGAVRARSRTQRLLVIAQVAASLVMLASASTLFGAFQRTLRIDPGFDTVGLRRVLVNVSGKRFDSIETRRFANELLMRARADTRIGTLALTSAALPAPWMNASRVFRAEDAPSGTALADPAFTGGSRAYVDAISDGYFSVLGVPILLGRDFTPDEVIGRASVAIISRRLADALWPRQNPLGRVIAWPSARGVARPPVTVVGVVGDVHHATLSGGPSPVMYLPDVTRLRSSPFLIYRAHGGVATAALSQLLASMKSDLSLTGENATNLVDDDLLRQRIVSAWIGVFGVVALLLATIGVYGVIAQSVYQRTRELAVRAAVGARPGELLRHVLADGVRLAAFGTMLGALGVALAFQSLLRTSFVGMQVRDLATSAIGVVVLAMATLLASFIPARRAARLSPADALRSD